MRHTPESRRCKRGCCWSPYACGKQYACTCHHETHTAYAAQLRLEALLDALEDED
jgi:hypothetical protein